MFDNAKLSVRIDPCEDPDEELDRLCLSKAFPMLAASSAVVDFEGARLAKYSSVLALSGILMLVGVRALDPTGDLIGSGTKVRLPDVLER